MRLLTLFSFEAGIFLQIMNESLKLNSLAQFQQLNKHRVGSDTYDNQINLNHSILGNK
jgi:hypothetical protein